MKFFFNRVLFLVKKTIGQTSPVEDIVRQSITKPQLFKQAFKHGGGIDQSYDRLEFLGDAVLQLVVSDFLYKKFPNYSEGKLTQIRSRLVRRSALNLLGYRLGLGKYINSNFLTFDGLTDENKRIFGDTLESMVGALYLNSGYKGVRFFVVDILIDRFVKFEELENSSTNYKGELVELSQKMNFDVEYLESHSTNSNSKITLLINNKPLTTAYSKTKKKAEQKAAKKVLDNKEQILKFLGDEEE